MISDYRKYETADFVDNQRKSRLFLLDSSTSSTVLSAYCRNNSTKS